MAGVKYLLTILTLFLDVWFCSLGLHTFAAKIDKDSRPAGDLCVTMTGSQMTIDGVLVGTSAVRWLTEE